MFVVFSLTLGIGVNSSVVFARTVSDIPVIGSYSQLMIVRPEIKEALQDHDDLQDAIDHGRLKAVSISDEGVNSGLTVTLDSFLADEFAFTGFFTLEGNFDPIGFYVLRNIRITDLASGEERSVIEELRIFEKSGEFYMNRFFWNQPCGNFTLDFELWDVPDDYGKAVVLDTYHFELHNVDITPAKHIPVDQTVSVEGHDVHICEIQMAESGTLAVYDSPDDFQLWSLSLEILDKDGNILSETVPGTADFIRDDKHHCVLTSFFYTEEETVTLHVISAYCEFSDMEVVKIDPQKKSATFNGETIPVQVFSSRASYSDFGLPSYAALDAQETILFVIPSERLPKLNGSYFPMSDQYSFSGEYPHVVIDNTDYIVIQCPTYFMNDEDCCFYFLNCTAPNTYPLGEKIDISLT